jgi:hypothetical protein
MAISRLRILSPLQNYILRYNKMAFQATCRAATQDSATWKHSAQAKSAKDKHVSLHFINRPESGCLRDERRDLLALSYSPVCIGGNCRESRDRPAGFPSQLRNRRPAGKGKTAEPSKKLFGCLVYGLAGRVLFFYAVFSMRRGDLEASGQGQNKPGRGGALQFARLHPLILRGIRRLPASAPSCHAAYCFSP